MTRVSRKIVVTPSDLRAEGVFEVGMAAGTGLLFVVTEERVLLLHIGTIPDRKLDDYALALALNWMDGHGYSAADVAGYLDVSPETLRAALVAAGHQRNTPAQLEHFAHARMCRRTTNTGSSR